MNALVSKTITYCVLCLSLWACAENEKVNPGDQRAQILRSKDFAGISDSIERWPSDPRLLLTRATRLSQHNFYKLATPDYRKAYELTGDEGVALEYASNLLLAEETDEAMKVLREGASRFEDNTEFNRRLAEIYIEQGDLKTALEEYEILLAKDSANFEAWYDLGSLLLRSRDTSGAINALEKSFAILPINYSGMMLANVYVSQKNPRALDICNALIQSDSSGMQIEPVYMKGVYYSEIRNYAKAIEQFDECIRRDWKTTDAYIEKGIIYFEQKKYDEALKTFNLAATVSNTDADVYFWIGRCEEAKGNKQQAITNYRRALALDDAFTEAKVALRRLNS
jgi:tetratricopeptide (TPR) repeat protein